MLIAIVAGLLITPSPPQRIERMMALARLDAAVRYFDPSVATRPSSWDSLFVASATRIVDAPSSAEYARAIAALMSELHPGAPTRGEPQRGLAYDGFPNAATSSSGGYRIKWRSAGSGETYRVEMGEGASAEVPISEPGADTTPVVNALAMPASPEWSAPFPSPGYRLLAAARLWSTIRLFYPYKALIGESWDDQLRAALPAFENAKDSLEYAQAVARFASHIHDTHVTTGSPALSAYIGTVPVGAAARLIENQLVITRIADSSASRAGLRVGDVVLSVDGEATAQRIAGLTPLYATSTPQSMRYRLQQVMLNGRDSAPAHLVVRGADGERTVGVPRSRRFGQLLSKNRTGSMIRLLPGNIGYIDIDRLPQTSVDSAFRVLANTKAIIIDDRGYPLGTAWAIAPRLNRHTDGAGLWMRIDGGGGTMALDNMMNRALRGTMDWTKVSIVLDVPTDADGLSFGLLLSGPGESWIDDASVEIVGSDVSATAPTVTTPTRAGVPVEKVRRMYDTAPLAPVNLGFEPG
jgi:hypothetical protein